MAFARPLLFCLAASVVLLSGLPVHGQYAQDSLAFDLDHVFELEYATDPQVAPDGEQVVYARTSMDKMKDRRRSRLWVVGADGNGHRPITAPEIGRAHV